MNKGPVSREEFETLKGICEGMAQHNVGTCDLLRGLHNRICDLESRLADASAILPERIMYVERLLDAVKDGLLATAHRVGHTAEPPGTSLYSDVCERIAKSQQPPAPATGEPVVIDPAASAAATTNERATEGQRIGLYEPIHPCPTEETIP